MGTQGQWETGYQTGSYSLGLEPSGGAHHRLPALHPQQEPSLYQEGQSRFIFLCSYMVSVDECVFVVSESESC